MANGIDKYVPKTNDDLIFEMLMMGQNHAPSFTGGMGGLPVGAIDPGSPSPGGSPVPQSVDEIQRALMSTAQNIPEMSTEGTMAILEAAMMEDYLAKRQPNRYVENWPRKRMQQQMVETQGRALQEQQKLAQQQAIQRGDQIYNSVFQATGDKEQAVEMAQLAMQSPEAYQEIAKQVAEHTGSAASMREEGRLNQFYEAAKGTPEGSDQWKRFERYKDMLSKRGQTIKVGPDGTITISEGADLPVEGTEKAAGDMFDKGTQAKQIHSLTESFNPDFFTYKGRAIGAIGDVMDKFGSTNEAVQFAANRLTYVNESKRRIDEYRRLITGQQASQRELERMEQRLANAAENGATAFKTQMENELKIIYEDYNNIRTKEGLDPVDFSGEQYRLKWPEFDTEEKEEDGMDWSLE
jgi:hypothetical protein